MLQKNVAAHVKFMWVKNEACPYTLIRGFYPNGGGIYISESSSENAKGFNFGAESHMTCKTPKIILKLLQSSSLTIFECTGVERIFRVYCIAPIYSVSFQRTV